jgi:hypothetical protein
VKDEATLGRTNDDDVVVGARPILDQRQHRSSVAVDLVGQARFGPGNRHRGPPPTIEVTDQIGGPNAASVVIHQVRERFGVHAAHAPEAQHHRRSGAAAEVFGLRNEGNVENAKSWLGCNRAHGQRQQQAEPDDASRDVLARLDGSEQVSGQSMATTRKMMTRSAMMIVVVDITTVDAPPASACSTC